MMNRPRQLQGLAFLLLMVLSTTCGCILSVSKNATTSGTFVPDTVTDKIVLGQTTRQWVVDRLGPPTETEMREDGVEILRYRSKRRTTAHVGVILLLNIDDVSESTHTLVFEIRDGVVQDFDRIVATSAAGTDTHV